MRGGAFAVLVLICLLPCPPAHANTRSQQLYTKALIPFHAQRWEEAYLLLDDATKADPEDALAAYYRGLTGARLGFTQDAIKNLEHALSLRPDLSAAVLDLGILYFEAGQYAAAQEWLERAYQQPANRFAAAFFLGLTRLRQGDAAGGVTYLTEAAKDPALRPSAQYYQAVALSRDGKATEARQLFTEVEAERPDAEIGQIAKQYLAGPAAAAVAAAPEEEAAWSVYGNAGFGYDSNVALAPNDSSIKDAIDISGESTGFFRTGLGGRVRAFDAGVGRGVLGYDFYQSVHFTNSEFDLQNHRLHLTLTTPVHGPLQAGITGAYDFYALDYQTFYQQGRGTPWVTLFEGRVAASQLYYSFTSQDYFREPFSPFRDAYNNAVGVRQYFLLGAADRSMSLGYQWDDNDPLSRDGTDFAYTDNRFDVRVDFGLFDWGRGTAGYLFDLEDYEHPNSRTGFTKRRHDREHQVVLHFHRPLTTYLDADLVYLGVFNQSNIPNFEYDRNLVQAGVSLHF